MTTLFDQETIMKNHDARPCHPSSQNSLQTSAEG